MVNEEMPLVSIVMATYNGSKYIKEQIESILNQDYTNFELIIIDDCSKDNTVDILREYASKDKRICLYPSEINKGVVKTFEYGLSLAKGDYIALSDQDDIFDQNKISIMVTEMQNNSAADLAVSDLRLIDQDNNIISNSMWRYQKLNPKAGKPFKQLLYANFVTGCACMIRKRLLASALPFPNNCIIHDWWLSVIASSENNGGIVLINQPLISYRQHGNNVIGARSGNLTAAISRAPNLEQRIAFYTKNLYRINGYLENSTFTKTDQYLLNNAKILFEGLINENKNNLYKRITLLPLRLNFASTQNNVHIFGIILFTIFPYIVDFIQNINKKS